MRILWGLGCLLLALLCVLLSLMCYGLKDWFGLLVYALGATGLFWIAVLCFNPPAAFREAKEERERSARRR